MKKVFPKSLIISLILLSIFLAPISATLKKEDGHLAVGVETV